MLFSILIPTWNNLDYLKWCIHSIQKNSSFSHQIIVHINEGSDGTLAWVKASGVNYTLSETNIGVCRAVNQAAALAVHDYIVFMNDDMYCLPQWDVRLAREIQNLHTDSFMLSSTMIEPRHTGNKCVVVRDYGSSAASFAEEQLLAEWETLVRPDWSGSTWPPNVVHRNWWNKVGGYSEEFSPGMSSDDDFAMKMWQSGCRMFKGIGDSLCYHFISKSTGRVVKNNGRKQFRDKWHLKQSTFHKYYTRRGMPFAGVLPEKPQGIGLLWHKMLAWFSTK